MNTQRKGVREPHTMTIEALMQRPVQWDTTKTPNKRDKIILEAYKMGASVSILEFQLSRQRIYSIINRYKK
ncbi:MAG: hypothetical protein ACO3UU_07155 [Minisyncoccia bacterium]